MYHPDGRSSVTAAPPGRSNPDHVVQPTSDHVNIFKIKPPLCIDVTAVNFFAEMLDRALAELGHAAPEGRPGSHAVSGVHRAVDVIAR
ncbi:hypothetical protein ACH419_32715 [Streptomyces bobili]|uniref:hypothetical protein n=1 Tax=Streptomyces bobili TaxID=67280 RepID=UPI0037B0BA20